MKGDLLQDLMLISDILGLMQTGEDSVSVLVDFFFEEIEFQGPFGPLRNSSTCGGLARFAHKGLGFFCIFGNKKQRCD